MEPEQSGRRWAAGILAGMIVLTLYASEVIGPEAQARRLAMHEPGLSESAVAVRRANFGRTHRRSVMVHGTVLLLGVVLLVLDARRAAER